MRTERRKSGSARGDEKLAAERQCGAHRLLNRSMRQSSNETILSCAADLSWWHVEATVIHLLGGRRRLMPCSTVRGRLRPTQLFSFLSVRYYCQFCVHDLLAWLAFRRSLDVYLACNEPLAWSAPSAYDGQSLTTADVWIRQKPPVGALGNPFKTALLHVRVGGFSQWYV